MSPASSRPTASTATPRAGTSRRFLLVQIDRQSSEPLQTQLYFGIRESIRNGTIAPGARLPSSRDLADDLGVSRTTTVLTYEQLAAEGYLTTRRGSGTFVTDDLPDDGVDPLARVRSQGPQHPPLSIRGQAAAAVPPIVRRIAGPPRPFRIGTPALDRFPVQVWTRLMRRHVRSPTIGELDYGPAAGLPALREAIADHVSRARGTTCVADQVIVVAGAQQGLDLVARLLIDPGDVACMEEPGYPGARAALVAAGASIRPVPVDRHGLDVDAGMRDAAGARLIYVTPSHQFPLGVSMSLPRRQALVAWARTTGAWIVEDDYDAEFRYGDRPIPCLHGIDADGRVIYVGSFSKTLFPALRLGYLIVPPDLRDAVLDARRAVDIHPPSASQAVVADLMTSGAFERHLRLMRGEYRARLDALVDGIATHCGGALTLRPVATGLHAVADLSDLDDDTVAREAMAKGIEVMPVSAYRMTAHHADKDNALVLGFGAVRPDVLRAGAERLAAAIDAVRRRRRQ